MAKSTPRNIHNVQLSIAQIKLLDKLVDQELKAFESGYAHPNPTLLKRTCDVLWKHLQPSPAQKQKRMELWIKKIYGGARDARQGGTCAHEGLMGAAS